jgi:hypothetical protein
MKSYELILRGDGALAAARAGSQRGAMAAHQKWVATGLHLLRGSFLQLQDDVGHSFY